MNKELGPAHRTQRTDNATADITVTYRRSKPLYSWIVSVFFAQSLALKARPAVLGEHTCHLEGFYRIVKLK